MKKLAGKTSTVNGERASVGKLLPPPPCPRLQMILEGSKPAAEVRAVVLSRLDRIAFLVTQPAVTRREVELPSDRRGRVVSEMTLG